MVKKVYSVATLVLNALAILFALVGPMFQERSTSTSYYGGHGSVSNGSWYSIGIFEETAWLAVLILICSITMILLSLILLFKQSDLSSKFISVIVFALIAQFIVSIIAFSTPAGLSSSSTSGIGGAWSSSGTTVQLAGMGWLYMLCSLGSIVACIMGLLRRE